MPESSGKRAFHRRVWQKLPRRWRRSLFLKYAAVSAPAISQSARSSDPVIVAGYLSTASGLGQSARLCHDALAAAGIPVLGIDLSASLLQPINHHGFAFQDARGHRGPATLIVHTSGDMMPFALLQLGRKFVQEKYVVGYWAWELEHIPDDWMSGSKFVREIWAPSEFTANAVRSAIVDKPVKILPHPVLVGMERPRKDRQQSQPFTVLTVFDVASSFARKNPMAVVRAFTEAFASEPGVRLIIKASNLEAYPAGREELRMAAKADPRIELRPSVQTRDDLLKLYNEADVLISLHRSEGFGLTLAEAMCTGLPIIATGWSGSTGFLNSDNGVPVPCTLVPAIDPQGTYHHPNCVWAEPDIKSAAAALRAMCFDQSLRNALTSNALDFAAREWNSEIYAKRFRNYLNQ